MATDHSTSAGHAAGHLSQQAHRRLIGILGLLLPLIVYIVACLRPTPPLDPARLLTSVSAYYYTGAVAIFIGVLFALALFLLTYPGYEEVSADRIVGKVAGFAALGVAVFPTAPPEGLLPPDWWTPTLRVLHYVSAAVLFVAFILFALWLFRKSSTPSGEQRSGDKRARDGIYLACGLIMIAAVLWAASSLITKAPIFWPEAIAIGAFAVSWLTKGEAEELAVGGLRRLRLVRTK